MSRVIRKEKKMAFSLSGVFSRIWKTKLCGLVSPVPATEMQVRDFAARRGTREKALKKKRALKLKRAAMEAKKIPKDSRVPLASDVMKTTHNLLPPPPTKLNVYFADLYQSAEYTIIEALRFHREDLHPSVLHQPGAAVDAFIELNMTGEKKTKTVKPWSSVVIYPYPFGMGMTKKVLVLCPEDQKATVLKAGADFAGGVALMKEIRKGTFNVAGFDSIVGSVSLHDEINVIRSHLKSLHPKKANGTLTDDVVLAVQTVKFGLQYTSYLSDNEDKFGWVKVSIGKLNMSSQQLERNFITLLKSVESKRPRREGDFITHVYSVCPPSRERIKINFRPYLKTSNKDESSKVKEKKTYVAASN